MASANALAQPIEWAQTRTFSLNFKPPDVVFVEGGPAPGPTFIVQSTTLRFQGAPSTFTMGSGEGYRLSSVKADFTSVFDITLMVEAMDSTWGSSVGASGWTHNEAAVNLMGSTLEDFHTNWVKLFGANGDGFLWWEQEDYSSETVADHRAFDFARTWSDPTSFTGVTSFDVSLTKGVSVELPSFQSNDDWSKARNLVSDWHGSLSMTYVYEPVAAPVPEPASAMLLGAGLAVLLRCRRKSSRTEGGPRP